MEEVISNQVAFTRVATHMLKQKVAAMNEDGADCVYWNKDTGLKCAVGCLIREEDYRDNMEELGVRGLNKHGLLPSYLGDVSIELLGDLQTIHDEEKPEEWFAILAEYAIENNLNMPLNV